SKRRGIVLPWLLASRRVRNVASGQLPLKILHRGVRETRVVQFERSQLRQALEVREPRVGDGGLGQIKHTKVRKSLEVGKSRVRDARASQAQLFKTDQASEVFQAGIGDGPSAEAQAAQALETTEIR